MELSIAQAQDFFLVLTRTLAIMAAVPALGGRVVPARARLGFGLLLAAVLFPWGAQNGAGAEPLFPFLWDVARELVTGILAGMAVRLAFATLDTAATLMSQSVGFNAGATLNPAFEISGTAFDQMYGLLATLLFLVTNGHHQLLLGLARTFDLVPLRSLALDALGEERLMRLSAGMLLSAAQIALPVMAAMILVDVALGLLSRASPQINVFFMGAPVKVGVGLLALALALPMLIPAMTTLFDRITPRMLELIH